MNSSQQQTILCPFCSLPQTRILEENEYGFLILDAYPISPGHSLIIPKRHIGSWFNTQPEEKLSLLSLLDRAKEKVEEKHAPDGYNIGINDGQAAGQTVPHLHLHLIPRYQGDLSDPRGGVRWVLPNKAKYWK
jgi:diadenosine tetraphosphate (Ap4A) HIT family hydrolase